MLIASSSGATDFVNLHQSVKFVAGAYIFVLAVILIYVVIMATRLLRNQRELLELRKLVESRDKEQDGPPPAPGPATNVTSREPEQVA
jgi:hypothetical protein